MRRASELVVLAATLLAAACDRPDALVLCHNANCAGPPDPDRDDTIAALKASLALEYGGRPVIDGIEIDVFWNGARGRCEFAHDVETDRSPALAVEAAQMIAAGFSRSGPIAWNDERFHVKMEIKDFVGMSRHDHHTAAQRAAHAACTFDLYEIWRDAAIRAGRPIRVIFDSLSPTLLRAVVANPRWPGKHPHADVELALSADFLDPTRTGLGNPTLSEFEGLPLDIVEYHWNWVTDGQYQAWRSMGLETTMWMFSATVEAFDAIETLRPTYILTSEAPLVRRWLEY